MTQRNLKIEFETIVKEVVAPIFQGLGFKKSGNNFYRETKKEFGQAFNIQQSQFNSKDDKRFVFNLGLIDKESYAEIYNKEFPIFPKEHNCGIRLRLGHLMSKGDQWYILNKEADFSSLRAQVKSDIETFAVPFFEKYFDELNWIDFFEWQYEPLMSPIVKFLIFERCGERAKAEEFWNNMYNNALIPKPGISKISDENGQILTEFNPIVNKEWIVKVEDFAKRKKVELKITAVSEERNGRWWKRIFSSW
jgi:hypothetical protein